MLTKQDYDMYVLLGVIVIKMSLIHLMRKIEQKNGLVIKRCRKITKVKDIILIGVKKLII